MRRAPGWIRLAGIALELSALAFLGYVLMGRGSACASSAPFDNAADAAEPGHPEVSKYPQRSQAESIPSPITFIKESADSDARYFRASDGNTQLVGGFYSDGRVRLADAQHRFAGMLQSGHADLLELDNNQWSELFVHTTPAGITQLELRGGPYDARVFNCESFEK